jgi:hypothetical protein
MKVPVAAPVPLSLFFGLMFFSPALHAHSWYPKECCSDHDCAPVDTAVQLLPAGGGLPQLLITSRVGRALIPRDFPVRQSKDGRMHVCMTDIHLVCFFVPPTM